MKRLILLCSIALLTYIIYYDLSRGTLPRMEEENIMAASQPVKKETFKKLHVQKGESVLMIINKVNGHSIPVPLETAAEDFEKLNPGIKANRILTGHSYKFPVYE
ncbi:hypothetical protein J9317_13130 [Metabacillus sp. KIGAM252]|uniref:LysM domain-containing protein n=1 Tax=Metabacillus flavus TaxID=2823519 RepID=A0ABS5LH56_9BACI|nr:hypothetical protein [Metabacillus flavus]MBS2969709.1 hypothetical protein [Metabacillus flavus]